MENKTTDKSIVYNGVILYNGGIHYTFKEWVEHHYPDEDICFVCENTGQVENTHVCDCEYCNAPAFEDCNDCDRYDLTKLERNVEIARFKELFKEYQKNFKHDVEQLKNLKNESTPNNS